MSSSTLSHNRAVVYVVLAAALFSTTSTFIKLAEWNALGYTCLRSVVGAVVVGLFFRPGLAKLPRNHVIAVFFFAISLLTFVYANQLTYAAPVVVLLYTCPIYVALLSGPLLGEHPRPIDWLALSAVLLGVGLILGGSLTGSHLLGTFLGLLCGLAEALWVIYLRKGREYSTIRVLFIAQIVMAVLLAPSLVFAEPPTTISIIAILVSGLLTGIAYALFAKALESLTALESLLLSACDPVLAPIWAYLFLNETPEGPALIGCIVIVITVITYALFKGTDAARLAHTPPVS